ncbi:MAG: hypothetical protein ACLS5Q_03040 [Ruminococcus sp.]|nr:hypothetical protein [Oscillospiraceae bacterium]
MTVKNINWSKTLFFNKDISELGLKKYQRNVNNSKKMRPSLDSFKFSRDWSSKEDEEK